MGVRSRGWATEAGGKKAPLIRAVKADLQNPHVCWMGLFSAVKIEQQRRPQSLGASLTLWCPLRSAKVSAAHCGPFQGGGRWQLYL